MSRTPAQAAASRSNGARSRGPRTAEGKAVSARNAHTLGFRSAGATLHDRDDQPHFREIEAAIHHRYQPTDSAEASLCARMVMALWRGERADLLESEHWCLLPPGAVPASTLRMARVLRDEETQGRRSLATILRYQAEATNGFTRALRALILLRSGKAEPGPASTAERTWTPLQADNTNEPEPLACTNEPETGRPAARPGPDQPPPAAGTGDDPPATSPEPADRAPDARAVQVTAYMRQMERLVEADPVSMLKALILTGPGGGAGASTGG